jgi:hypothetical protein
MSRSRSPRDLRAEPDLRAALAAMEAELAAERAGRAADRNRAATLQWRWLDRLHEMAEDIRQLAALAHRAGVTDNLVDRWHVPQPAPLEPEAEPSPREQ